MSLVQMPQVDAQALSRRPSILSGLSKAAVNSTVISDEGGLRAFESDALTAYRGVPLGAVLPTSTAEVARVLKFCSENKVKVVARGAGPRLAAARFPPRTASWSACRA